jgi:PAS domain S-box-containing protein
MESGQSTKTSLQSEIEDLRRRLQESEETLRAIRDGEVEALVISGQIYTLESSDAASNRFRGDVLEQVTDIVVAVDNELRISYINPAGEAKYGVKASDVLGRPLDSVFTNKFLGEDTQEKAYSTVERDGFWNGETIQVKLDGSEFCAEASVSKIFDGNGDPMGLLAVIRDITRRKEVEEELRQARDRLEIRVAERTRELAATNEQLRQEVIQRTAVERQRGDLLKRVVSSQEDERRRIARDIHDKLGQRVTALRLQIASFSDNFRDPEKFAGNLELLQRTALRLDSEVSFLAWELRPAALDDLGLPEAARAYLEDWSHNYKISSDFSLRGLSGYRLDPDVETHLYRIMQEGLNNIIKHAKATNVNVLLERRPDVVSLIIEDNGKGFDTDGINKNGTPGHGLGLLGMRERAMLVGGDVHIESGKGSGTTLFISVPTQSGQYAR